MGNSNLKELQENLDKTLNLKGGAHKHQGNVNVQRAAAWKSTGIVALRDAGLQVIPDPVFELGPVVRSLDVLGNKIDRVPNDGLAMLVGLQRLTLSGNLLVSLPPSLGHLTSLKMLALDSNRLQELPPEIGSCTKLEQLSVMANKLKSLPASIGCLKQLSILDISKNEIETLPASIGDLSSLKELQASSNKLKSIPSSMQKLEELDTLILEDNQITQLPPELLSGCQKLHTLSLQANPFPMHLLKEMDGFEEHEARRRHMADKRIASNVMMK